MSDTGYYPPEYGIEVGETCYRGRCRGRMIAEREECSCWADAIDEADASGDPLSESFVCTCGIIVVCGVCGEGSNEY